MLKLPKSRKFLKILLLCACLRAPTPHEIWKGWTLNFDWKKMIKLDKYSGFERSLPVKSARWNVFQKKNDVFSSKTIILKEFDVFACARTYCNAHIKISSSWAWAFTVKNTKFISEWFLMIILKNHECLEVWNTLRSVHK